ncbi:MAG: hypothetical protein OXD43_11495 [Bacteroidetes bacterium]|nr:hypothetical protein [Bacteroidota bacterium]
MRSFTIGQHGARSLREWAAVHAALAPAPNTNVGREEASSFVAKTAAYKPYPVLVSKARQRSRICMTAEHQRSCICSLAAGRSRWKPHNRDAKATLWITTWWRT